MVHILSFLQVDDVPDFLAEKDRHKTVHVRVLYHRRMRDKTILPRLTQSHRSPRLLRQLARRTKEISPDNHKPSSSNSPSRESKLQGKAGRQPVASVESPLLISTRRGSFKHQKEASPPRLAVAVTPPSPQLRETSPPSDNHTRTTCILATHTPVLSRARFPSDKEGQMGDNSYFLSAPHGSYSHVTGSTNHLSFLGQREQLCRSTGCLNEAASNLTTAPVKGASGLRGSVGTICSAQEEGTVNGSALLANGAQWNSTLSLGLSELAEDSTTNEEESEESVRMEVVSLEIYVLKNHTYFRHHFVAALEDYRIVSCECCIRYM